MDDLFSELEQALARESLLMAEPEPAETPAPPAKTPAESIAASGETAALMPRLTPRQLGPGEIEPDPDVVLAVSQASHPAAKRRSFDMLLLSTLCASFLTTGILWLWLRNTDRLPLWGNQAAQTAAPVAEAPPLTPEQIQAAQQQQFLSYVNQSLDRIEQAAKADRLAQRSQTAETPAASPTPSQTVLERVYVPVYPPPQVITAQPNVVIQQPSGSATAPTIAPTVPAPAPNVPNIAAASSYKLIGVLELGDRSAALFEVNGSPRRVQVGEAIGDSGWTLVSVSNQEAIVRRNGEVRSIYVGQQF